MVSIYPFNDELLLNAKIMDVAQSTEIKFSAVEYLVEWFNLLKKEDMGQLEQQFAEFQVNRSIDQHIDPESRIDTQWYKIGKIKDLTNKSCKYSLLAQVMKAVLSIFHSNADCERTFSLVTKNKTKERYSMGTQTLSNIITHKSAMTTTCFEVSYSKDLLKKAKQATRKYNSSSNSISLPWIGTLYKNRQVRNMVINTLRGYCTPGQFLDCFCIFLKNYNTLVTSKICFLQVTFQGT